VASVIVLDASVLIAHLDATDTHHVRATDLLIDFGGEQLVATTLTLAEVLVGPTRVGREAVAQVAIERLDIIPHELPAAVSQELATIRATTGLKMPDCCVLWTAVASGSAPLATFDQQLARAATERGVTVHGCK
jgi:predicted nucleic acid-binding protein